MHLQCYFPGRDPLLPPLTHFIPPLFLLTWRTPFDDCGANVHPLSSPVGDQLFTPCSLTLHNPSWRHPQFMLHVYRDDITTSVTLSDTITMAKKEPDISENRQVQTLDILYTAKKTFWNLWNQEIYSICIGFLHVCTGKKNSTAYQWNKLAFFFTCSGPTTALLVMEISWEFFCSVPW